MIHLVNLNFAENIQDCFTNVIDICVKTRENFEQISIQVSFTLKEIYKAKMSTVI